MYYALVITRKAKAADVAFDSLFTRKDTFKNSHTCPCQSAIACAIKFVDLFCMKHMGCGRKWAVSIPDNPHNSCNLFLIQL